MAFFNFRSSFHQKASFYLNHSRQFHQPSTHIGLRNRVLSFKTCTVSSLFSEPSFDVMEHDNPLSSYHRTSRIVGSCNGLLCITIELKSLYLWNPSTRILRRIPKLGFQCPNDGHDLVYGFGYDSSTDDYKVVAILSSGEREARVYTLKTNSWRRIENFLSEPDGVPGLFVGGSLHWPALQYDRPGFYGGQDVPALHYSWHIFGIDLATEKYMEVPLPVFEGTDCDRNLGSLGGFLCVLANCGLKHADIWVMKEYGIGESWSKLFTILYPIDLWYTYRAYYRPLWYFKNGELLLEFEAGLVLYNLKDNTFKSPVLQKLLHYCFKSIIYVDSLVSPNAEDIVERLHQ